MFNKIGEFWIKRFENVSSEKLGKVIVILFILFGVGMFTILPICFYLIGKQACFICLAFLLVIDIICMVLAYTAEWKKGKEKRELLEQKVSDIFSCGRRRIIPNDENIDDEGIPSCILRELYYHKKIKAYAYSRGKTIIAVIEIDGQEKEYEYEDYKIFLKHFKIL